MLHFNRSQCNTLQEADNKDSKIPGGESGDDN